MRPGPALFVAVAAACELGAPVLMSVDVEVESPTRAIVHADGSPCSYVGAAGR